MSSEPPLTARTTVPKMGCGYAVCAVLAVLGFALLVLAENRLHERRRVDAWVSGGVGVLLCLASVMLIAPMRRSVAKAAERRRREDARPTEPWTWEVAWLDRRGIRQAGRRHGRGLLFFAIIAVGLSVPALLALPDELSRGNRGILVVLLFPLAGIWILIVTTHDAWRRRKYGTARFIPAEVPVTLGGELSGMVIVDRAVVPISAGRASLDCWCTTVENASKRRHRETVLTHTERTLAPSDWVSGARESRVFIHLPVRGGSATSMHQSTGAEPAYEWRLRIEMPTAGADFVAEFVLPVFGIHKLEPATATSPALSASPGSPRNQVRRGEVWRAAEIREEVHGGVGGANVLLLPHSPGRSLVGAPLAMTLIFAGLAVTLWLSPVPGVIAIVIGVFAALPAIAVFSLWKAGGERIWVERDYVCVQRGDHAVRRISRSDLRSIELSRDVGVGAQQFYRVVARCTPARAGRLPRRVVIATMVRGDEAAAEVLSWVEERLTDASR